MADPSTNHHFTTNEWAADVKVAIADPAVLPIYTRLPDSPPGSQLGIVPSDSASNSGSGSGDASPTCAEGLTVFKLLWTGLIAIILPPAIVTAAALVSAAAMLYGCGKILEGTGRALAIGPEMLWRAAVAKRAKRFVRAFRGPRAREAALAQGVDADVEAGAIAI
ncbi:hypothetical protein C8Q80DRAFT_428397 [Daedaleopsis nitida]|nr:hypothetical protein C8Q80DRAFT_428397 [Daedaleopsis nitida]